MYAAKKNEVVCWSAVDPCDSFLLQSRQQNAEANITNTTALTAFKKFALPRCTRHAHKQTILPFYKQARVKESHLLILLRGDGHIRVCWLRWKTLLVIQRWWLYRRFFRMRYADWMSAVQFKQPRHLNGMLFFSVCARNCGKLLLNLSVKIEQTILGFLTSLSQSLEYPRGRGRE